MGGWEFFYHGAEEGSALVPALINIAAPAAAAAAVFFAAVQTQVPFQYVLPPLQARHDGGLGGYITFAQTVRIKRSLSSGLIRSRAEAHSKKPEGFSTLVAESPSFSYSIPSQKHLFSLVNHLPWERRHDGGQGGRNPLKKKDVVCVILATVAESFFQRKSSIKTKSPCRWRYLKIMFAKQQQQEQTLFSTRLSKSPNFGKKQATRSSLGQLQQQQQRKENFQPHIF